jgi:uncharacterized membrane protein (DUF106 family)
MEINFFWIVSQIILSIIIISIIHYIYVFFKDNLTVPKIKDLVKKPKQQYTNIYESLKEAKKEKKEKEINMKSELKNYIKQLSNKQSINGKNDTNPQQLGNESFNNNNFSNNNFSAY